MTAELPGRTGMELLAAQLDGLARWHRELERRLEAAATAAGSREMRLDSRRRIQALRRAQTALVARADESIEQSLQMLGRGPVRGVVVHRDPWLRAELVRGLAARGLEVVADVADGADGLGLSVVEQPDLIVIEDRLPSLSGVELVRAVLDLVPGVVIGVQVQDDQGSTELLEAGATAVFSRRTPLEDVCDQLVTRLRALSAG